MSRTRLWWIVWLLAALGVVAAVGSVSAFACEDFPYFDARAPGVSAEVAQQRAQAWADGLSSAPRCQLQSAQAFNGFGKAHYQEPAPIEGPAYAVMSVLSLIAALGAYRIVLARRRAATPGT